MNFKSALIATALVASSLSAQADTYLFSQTGFNGGGILTGSFSGADLDLNGILDASYGEVSSFSLSFSGGTFAPAFTLGYGDLAGLTYQISSGNFLGDNGVNGSGEGIAAWDALHSYFSGIGPLAVMGGQIGDASFNPLTTTTSLISVTAVPEPQSFAMLLAGLGLMGFMARRRRAR
jgi:hypothetical protein